MMKKLILWVYVAFCAGSHAQSQPGLAINNSEPFVAVDNIAITHEHKGWRVVSASTMPIHFNLIKGDLIIRIDGKNAAETGPMIMASLLNEGDRRSIHVFVERGGFGMETTLRQIVARDLDPAVANPFRHVASGFSAPDEELNDIDGKPLTLEQFRGKWLLISFTATWCAPCMDALPKVLTAVEHNDLRLNLLTVALEDKADKVRSMRQKYQVDSPIAMLQPMSQLPIDFGISTSRWTGQIPALVLIRPNGEVALIETGVDPDHIERNIDCLMGCQADQGSK